MAPDMDNGMGRAAWVVIVVVGIVATLVVLYPRLRGQQLDKRALAESRLRLVYSALTDYADQYGNMPAHLEVLRDGGFLALQRDLVDPERAEQEGGYSFVTNVRFGDPEHWLVVFDDGPNPRDGYRHVLFVDGRVGRYPQRTFQEFLSRMAEEMRAAGRAPPLIVGD